LPFLGEPGKLDSWVGFISSVLTSSPGEGSHLTQNTASQQVIEQLDGEEWWKLKAACAKTALKLFQNFHDY
jgi:hypothetical protein